MNARLTTKELALLLSYGWLIAFCPFKMPAQSVALPTSVSAGEGGNQGSILPRESADLVAHPSPRVTCQANELTIAAENSTLGSILSAVRSCIGVDIDIPDADADELSYVQMGPGPTREVLDSLLSSTGFNYVIQSSNSEPAKISRILVISRTKGVENGQGTVMPAAAGYTMTPARQAWLESIRALKAGTQTGSDGFRVAAEPVRSDTGDGVRGVSTGPAAAMMGTAATDLTQTPKETDIAAKAVGVDVQQGVGPSDTILVIAPPDPPSELQNKIGEMQQMFEQRRKMTANSGAPPAQN